jgi:hypothetical protein
VSRLYDRVVTEGCQPLTAGRLGAHGGQYRDEDVRREIKAQLDRPASERELDRLVAAAVGRRETTVVGPRLDPAELEETIVIAGDDVARYFAEFPLDTKVTDVVSSVAPPFPRFFVEFDGSPNPFGLSAWGVLFEERQPWSDDGTWLVAGTLIEEWRRGKPTGPVITWLIPLAADGSLLPGDEQGHGSLFVEPLDPELVPSEIFLQFGDTLTYLLAPALLTVSFMHCRNVDVHRVEPPAKLSRKAERRRGRPLTQYYVLEIEPMRRALEREGQAGSQGLSHALHICRGHFKTYADTAPLFGRYTGTYWWASHVRGSVEEGAVEKDYRLRLEEGTLGRPYEFADEHVEIALHAPEHMGLDSDLGGRGLRAHAITQNMLAQAVERAGHAPRRPRPDEPQYDLAWQAGATTWVAEVKSLTPQNEERQLRLALGQVVRYRQLLAPDGQDVRAVIGVEREPSDSSWRQLCADEGIVLLWPGQMDVGNIPDAPIPA